MGLGAVKNKRKIGDDPNNTKWARNTDAFGQKILRAHGWEPGQYLGSKSEAYSAFHTAASASHIRAVLREDNLGIGAKPAGASADQCTGLDVFKDLLGRLNGKSEAVIEEQQQARESVRMTLYVERKFGPMRFVRGGLLVGDSMQEEGDIKQQKAPTEGGNDTITSAPESVSIDGESSRRKAKKDKKRKEKGAKGEEKTGKKEKRDKKEKKESSKKRKAMRDDDDDDDDDDDELETGSDERQEKKAKRRKREEDEATVDEEKPTKDKTDKKKKKKDDKNDKKDRDKKKRRKEVAPAAESADETADESAKAEAEDSAPVMAAPSTSLALGRHLSRRRYIAQKRAAFMDPQALKQIFMIKT